MLRSVIPVLLLPLVVACSEKPEAVLLGKVENCDAAKQSCFLKSEAGLNVYLSLGPDVQPLKPFPVELRIEGMDVEAESVIADFQMQGMDMGINRYRLSRDGERWRGEVTLPVCTASRMDWFTEIEVTADGKDYRAIFPFQTTAN